MEVTSKRHFKNFYLAILLGAMLLIGLNFMALRLFFSYLQQGEVHPKIYLLPVISFLTLLYAIKFAIDYIKAAPQIVIDNECLIFKYLTRQEEFKVDQLSQIKFTGKCRMKVSLGSYHESMKLTFENGTEKVIFDHLYSNSNELKLFLKEIIGDKQIGQPAKGDLYRTASNSEIFQYYKGNQFVDPNGILLWVFISVVIGTMIFGRSNASMSVVILCLSVCAVFFLLISRLMYYFGLSAKYLRIQNHNFFWISKIYEIEEIKEVVFDTASKLPNCLRVITNDYKQKLYPATTLSKEQWLQLIDDLEQRGIKVRNELRYD